MQRIRRVSRLLLGTSLLVTVIYLLAFRHQSKNYHVPGIVFETDVGPVRGYLLPRDDEIDAMSNDELTIAYWRYVNTLQILCYDQMRFGSFHDGGKELCVDDAYRLKNGCLVYSFGSNFQFDFERDVIRNFGCEVHTFDPSKPLTDKVKIPQGVTFHLLGLYGEKKENPHEWSMDVFPSIRNTLGHEQRLIDIVKMDIEGSEWDAIDNMIDSGSIYSVKQLCIEWHLGTQKMNFKGHATKKWAEYLKILRKLYEAGFRMFMHERGLHHTLNFKAPYPKYTSLIEISYINTRFYGNN